MILLFSAAACEPASEAEEGELVIDGDLVVAQNANGHPEFQGYVKNTGSVTVYNVEVYIIVYSDSTKTNVIDRATGFPGELGEIAPGDRVYFTAVCSSLTSTDQVAHYYAQLTWLDKT
jgi:hypothetical protein